MSSNRILTESDTGRDANYDDASGCANPVSENMERMNSSSLVKGDSLAVDNVEAAPSTADASADTGNPMLLDSSDGDSKPETTQSILTLAANSQGNALSLRHLQTDSYRAKDPTTNTANEDTGQNLATTSSSAILLQNNNGRYPIPLFCPLTRRLFQDPVVAPDGHTYERDALLQRGHDEILPEHLYPNRALQQILDEEPRHPLLEQLWENSLWPPDRSLPDAFYCPITFELMHVPVIDPEGNTYEKAAIVNWLRVNGHSPISRSPLTVTQLYPNHVLRELLEYHANEKPNHPVLSKWLTEPPPSVPTPTDVPIYPTTFEELEAHHARMRRQRRKVIACTILGVICLILAIVGAASYGGYCIFISIWLGCCVRDSFRRLRELRYEHHQQQLSMEEAHQRVEIMQERLRQMQQEEEEELQRLNIETDGPQFQRRDDDAPLDQQPQESAPPLTFREEQSVNQPDDNTTMDQHESLPRIEDTHEQEQQQEQHQQQEPIMSMTTGNGEQCLHHRKEEEEEPEVDLEEGYHLPTTTLQDPTSTANESRQCNNGPVSIMTLNLT